MKKWMFLILFIVSGCQSNQGASEEAYDLRTDQTAPNYMSNNNAQLNPDNIVFGVGNIGADTNKAKEVIADSNEFVTDSVRVNGDRMWVTVYKKGMLTTKEKVDAEARLHRKLIQALPRYQIEVRVQEDRR